MNLIDRVKNILTTPDKEWQVINAEPANPTTITTTYIVPLAAIGFLALIINYGVFGYTILYFKYTSMSVAIKMAIAYAIGAIGGPFLTGFIIDAVGPNFGVAKNYGKSFQVAAYSSTASLVSAFFLIHHSVAFLSLLGGLYGLFLLYKGLPVLRPTAEKDKASNYFVVVLLISIVVGFILYWLPSQILLPSYGL